MTGGSAKVQIFSSNWQEGGGDGQTDDDGMGLVGCFFAFRFDKMVVVRASSIFACLSGIRCRSQRRNLAGVLKTEVCCP